MEFKEGEIPGIVQPENKGRITTPGSQSVNDFHGRSDVDSAIYAQHHTLGLKRTQASPGHHDHDGVNSKRLIIPTILTTRLIADQTISSASGTFTSVTTLVQALEANSVYEFDMQLHIACSAVTNHFFTMGWTLPAGATIRWSPWSHNNIPGGIDFAGDMSGRSYTALQAAGGIAVAPGTDEACHRPVGVVSIAATAGNAQFQIARGAAAGNVIVRTHSLMNFRKI